MLVHEDQAERAAQAREHLERGGLERVVRVPGQQRGDQRGVGGVAARELAAPLAAVALGDEVDQLGGVGEVAVVPEGDGAGGRGSERRLRVLPGAATGGRVARVPDGDVPLQGVQRGLVEDLGDEAHVLVDEQLLTVGGGDARRLLAAVLQRVEAEVGQLGDFLARCPHTEDATSVLGAFFVGEEVVVQTSVCAGGHVTMVAHASAWATSAPTGQSPAGTARRRCGGPPAPRPALRRTRRAPRRRRP